MDRLSKDAQKTADYWDARGAPSARGRKQWWDLPAVLRHRNDLLSGNPELGFEAYIAKSYFAHRETAPGLVVLSLGCGRGAIDRRLAAALPIQSLTGIDIAEQNLALAQAAARQVPSTAFHYRKADLNRLQLEPASYDVVVAAGILHHLSALEHVFEQLQASLRAGGLLFLDEYVGPSRFQFSKAQRALIEDAFVTIPARLRVPYVEFVDGRARATLPRAALRPDVVWAKLRSGQLLSALRYRLGLWRAPGEPSAALRRPRFPTAVDVATGDPSEAVRSSEILGLLRRRFSVLEEKGTGLSLLQFLLADIAHHFVDADDNEAQDVLHQLIALERAHLHAGRLQHDFVFVAARRS